MTLPQQRFQWAEDIPRHYAKHGICIKTGLGSRHVGCGLLNSRLVLRFCPTLPSRDSSGFAQMKQCWVGRSRTFPPRWGNVLEPEFLYQPYRLETPAGDLAIVFRDHRLSDLMVYLLTNPKQAAFGGAFGSDRALPKTSARRRQHSTRTTLVSYHRP